jgi:hypothetical protein
LGIFYKGRLLIFVFNKGNNIWQVHNIILYINIS